jgi:hypothetical protein
MSTHQKKKNLVLLDFFKEDQDKLAWVCQVIVDRSPGPDTVRASSSTSDEDVKRCGAKISRGKGNVDLTKGTRAGNLRRHLQRNHPAEYKNLEKEENKKVNNNKSVPVAVATHSGAAKQTNLKHFYMSDKLTLTMKSEVFVDLLVRMVYKEGVALNFFSSDTCKLLLGELARKLGVSLDRNKVTEYVISAAEKQKEILKARVLFLFKYVFAVWFP